MADVDGDLGSVERAISAVTAIRQVVHAIWALSRAQLPLVEEAAAAAVTYQRWVDATVARIAGPPVAPSGARTLTVVFGPERPYSGALARRVVATIPDEGAIGLVGERLTETVRQSPRLDARVVFRCAGSVAHDDLHDVALSVARSVVEHARGAPVIVVHPSDDPDETRSVPLIAARAPVERPPETYSLLGEVVEAAVAEAIMGRLAVAAAEALRAELRARIVAADAARRACDERLAELEDAWHLGRRETITRELIEIVAGGEAAGALMTGDLP